MRKAIEKADFKSVRGNFELGANHVPIQNFYLQDVVKDGDDYRLKTVATIVENDQDKHAALQDAKSRSPSPILRGEVDCARFCRLVLRGAKADPCSRPLPETPSPRRAGRRIAAASSHSQL